MKWLRDSLTALDNKLDAIDRALTINTQQVNFQLARLEGIDRRLASTEREVSKVKDHVTLVNKLGRLALTVLGAVATIVGAVFTLSKLQ